MYIFLNFTQQLNWNKVYMPKCLRKIFYDPQVVINQNWTVIINGILKKNILFKFYKFWTLIKVSETKRNILKIFF